MAKNNPLHGELYWADLEPVKGSEQSGHRPVFIVSNNMMNKVSPVILVAPMTRTEKVINPFIIPYEKSDLILIDKNIKWLKKQGFKFDQTIDNANILCQQTRSISKDRLVKKIGYFRNDKYSLLVKDAISFLYALNGCYECNYPIRKEAIKCRNCGTVHNKKCYSCKKVFSIDYKFCPHCGKEAGKGWGR